MSYEKKLLQMKQMMKKAPAKVEKPVIEKPSAPSYSKAWEQVGLTRIDNDFGTVFKYEKTYEKAYEHGHYALGAIDDALVQWEAAAFSHPYAATTDETLVFFDTETTGLKGAGTYIFLLGFLTLRPYDVLLTQYVLADPAHEAALLFESKLWQRDTTIVSYNGKSFDWPQLQTRWTLNQHVLPPLKIPRHIDLLHSSRRLWKNDLVRMKLKQVEEEKLGFVRHHDIPGHLAPIIYMDAIKSGEPSALMKVLQHNEWDLLSLVTLYVHSTSMLMEAASASATAYTNVGKWYADLNEHERSYDILSRVTTTYETFETIQTYYYLGLQQKKRGDVEGAIASFVRSGASDDIRIALKSHEEAAKLYEHAKKNTDEALHMTNAALQKLAQDRMLPLRARQAFYERLQKRRTRLLKKNQ
ncbi:exonuclease [Caryophanon latum]|uniref:Exonuclease n=2 Tax=Caryophanon latum TaxID=33977 RepID=A0A1C0Z2F7_9BACL|nr:exonuclease [Caryophanon latum]